MKDKHKLSKNSTSKLLMWSLLTLQRMCGGNTAAERTASCLPIIVFNQRVPDGLGPLPTIAPHLIPGSIHYSAELAFQATVKCHQSLILSMSPVSAPLPISPVSQLLPPVGHDSILEHGPSCCMLKPAGKHQAGHMSHPLVRTHRCSG